MKTYQYTDPSNLVVAIYDEDGVSRSSCLAVSLPKDTVILQAEQVPTILTPVSPRQIRQALTRFGLRDSVENAINISDQDTKDWYEFATELIRTHEKVVMLGNHLGVTEKQLDDLWILAYSL